MWINHASKKEYACEVLSLLLEAYLQLWSLSDIAKEKEKMPTPSTSDFLLLGEKKCFLIPVSGFVNLWEEWVVYCNRFYFVFYSINLITESLPSLLLIHLSIYLFILLIYFTVLFSTTFFFYLILLHCNSRHFKKCFFSCCTAFHVNDTSESFVSGISSMANQMSWM